MHRNSNVEDVRDSQQQVTTARTSGTFLPFLLQETPSCCVVRTQRDSSVSGQCIPTPGNPHFSEWAEDKDAYCTIRISVMG